ncbi:dienelactone hydrolase [Undibacterium sp. GrIS 1.8]|uniref:dienelactone hydrolase family protein n=1 Tax=Undibacterium sp. GrIS 1.8 TaxID=3143934 RepID=UPI0033975845
MTVLIATDVFGKTPALASLVRSLGQNCLVISPFDDEQSDFRSEQVAYQAFIAQGGLKRYVEKIIALLEAQQFEAKHNAEHNAEQNSAHNPENKLHVIGFSVGASALWMVAASSLARKIGSAHLFYGSRIREYTHLQALCPTRLILAEREAAFDPAKLLHQLRQNKTAELLVELAPNTNHGFMNPYSGGFCVKAQAKYTQELALRLQSKAAPHTPQISRGEAALAA